MQELRICKGSLHVAAYKAEFHPPSYPAYIFISQPLLIPSICRRSQCQLELIKQYLKYLATMDPLSITASTITLIQAARVVSRPLRPESIDDD